MKRCSGLLLIAALITAGCGTETDTVPQSEPAVPMAVNPWDTIPPQQLYGATATDNLSLTPVELDVIGLPTGWDGARFAAISDLQLDLWSGNPEVAAAAMQMAAAAEPDFVVLLGDYPGGGTDPAPLRQILAPLRDIPTFAVLGDRDVVSDSLAARISAALQQAGVRVLKGEVAPLVINGDTAMIGGVDPEMARETVAEQRWIMSQLGLGTRMAVLLSHSPVLASRADNDRVPAAVAGGTFCGTVEVPGTPRIRWVNEEALPAAVVQGTERLYRIGPMVMFVTCGTGYGFVPVRYGAAPEVAMVTLLRVGASAEEGEEAPVDEEALLRELEGDTVAP